MAAGAPVDRVCAGTGGAKTLRGSTGFVDPAELLKRDRNTGAPTFVANVANDFATREILLGGNE